MPIASPASRVGRLLPPLGAKAWRLLGCVLLFEIGTGMTLPLVIVYLHDARGLTLGAAGLALSVMGAAGLIGTLIAGVTADRLGAGWTALAGLLTAAAGTAGFLVVHTVVSASVAAGLQGAGFAVTWVGVFPLLIRAVQPALRGEVLGTNYAATNLGLGIGSTIAGLILTAAPGSFRPLFIVDSVSYLLFAALLVALGQMQRGPAVEPGSHALTAYGAVVRDTRLLAAACINLLLVTAGYSQITAAFPAWATGQAGADQNVVGFAFAANTWTIAAVQLPMLALLRGHRRTRAIALTGLLFASCWLVVLAAGETSVNGLAVGALILSLAIFGVGETLLSPSLPGIVNDLAPEALRGRYVAFYGLSWQAGPMIGPLIAGAALGAGDGGPLLLGLAASCAMAAPAALTLERVLPAEANRPHPPG